jgi:peroxiredoxin
MADVAVLARLIVSAVFAVAGVAKLMDRDDARKAVAAFGVPGKLVAPFAATLPLVELAIAVSLLVAATAVGGAVTAIVLLALFFAAIARSLSRGRQPDCRCFGQLHSAPVSWKALARNAALMATAALVVAQGPGTGLGAWASGLSTIEWVGLLVAVGFVVAFVLEGRQLLDLLRRRDRATPLPEGVDPDPDADAASTWIPPSRAGLPVGTLAPDFAVRDLRRERVTLTSLRAPGHAVLLIFTDPICHSCLSMLGDIAHWQADHGAEVTIAVILCGTSKANLARITPFAISNVLLQKRGEVAEAYLFSGAPNAVLIGVDGHIASPMVVGPDAIRQLLETVVPRSYPQRGTKLGRT